MSRVLPFDPGWISTTEQELIHLYRSSHDPEEVLEAVRAVVDRERAAGVAMGIKRLSQGPRRTFWKEVRGGYTSYSKYQNERVFTSLEEIIDEAILNLGDLDRDAPVIVSTNRIDPHRYADYWIARGRYRVEVHFLPAWLCKAWPVNRPWPPDSDADRPVKGAR